MSRYAGARTRPIIAPATSISRLRHCATRLRKTMSKRMPARKNRMPISQAGGNTATVSLMMQVLRPQMAAAPRSMALYPHWGSAVAEVGGLFVMCVMHAIVAGRLKRIEGCASREVGYFKWGARERESKGTCRMAFAPSSGTRLRLKKKRPSVVNCIPVLGRANKD